jgi:mRNA interferase RelE/StbE
MEYKVEILPKALKSLEKIDPIYAKKIRERIRFLAFEPRHDGSVKLSGEKDAYRSRVGKYRIVYKIYDHKVLVVVVNVDHRKDVYR